MLADKRANIPRFIQLYEGRLRDWAEELTSMRGTVVAISRKGPRLLELLTNVGLLPVTFLKRVISERALPFIREPEPEFIVVDDHICWGSTFAQVFRLVSQVNERLRGSTKVIGLPFAINVEAHDKFVEVVSNSFLRLKPEEIASFVNNEASAFRMLGKPYDIEHPMLTFSGDFSDKYWLNDVLREATSVFDGMLIDVPMSVPTATGPLETLAWTILIEPNTYSSCGASEICKLRVYLNSDQSKLTVAAMQPSALPKSMFQRLGDFLEPPLDRLWQQVYELVPDQIEPPFQVTCDRSLVMWANFLNSICLLHTAKEVFYDALSCWRADFSWHGPVEEDLRFLVGPSMAGHAASTLAKVLNVSQRDGGPSSWATSIPDIEYESERFPRAYMDLYRSELGTFLSKAKSVDDAVQALFYAQHRGIELPSRKENVNSVRRLDFGITFNNMKQKVFQAIPNAQETDLHYCLDRLIDEGSIVPRYMELGNSLDPIWVRTYRVGEGPLVKLEQTVKLLFEVLAKEIGESTLPRLLFEKFCALVLSVASDHPNLSPLKALRTQKAFHLFGARMALSVGKERRFLLDWAVDQGILGHASPNGETDEVNGRYSLNQLELTYPATERPWDDHVKDALEDFAKLTAAIHKTNQLKGNALVLLTSLASEQEYHKAAEAELDLWLHDRDYSVHRALQKLGELAQKAKDGKLEEGRLKNANEVLWRTANFAAQVRRKKELIDKKANTYKQISELVVEDTILHRTWRDLKRSLDSRAVSEEYASGLTEILSALRIAYAMNRLLRDLLAHAGYRDPADRSKPLEETIPMVLRTLSDRNRVDEVTRAAFGAKEGLQDIEQLLEDARDRLPLDFPEAFAALRPTIIRIAEGCEQILRDYGSEEYRETPQILEPPQYLMMWDIRKSTAVPSREESIDPLVEKANRRIKGTFGDRFLDFRPESRNDGNGLICSSFTDVLAVYQILDEVFTDISFRSGVEVNMQGRLYYFRESRALGGRAFEHAARICALFKELEASPARWQEGNAPQEPSTNYLVVGEFALRYAEKEGSWPPNGYAVEQPTGKYEPRVHASLPIAVTILSRKKT